MTTLSYDVVYALGRSVGLSKDQAIIAAAIAAAESGLNPNNIGDQTLAKYGSRGLWQIFTGAHNPAELGVGSGAWTAALVLKLEVPATNAHAMWLISGHGKNWHPWSTFQHDSHLQYMPKATAAAARVGENWQAVLSGGTPVPTPTPEPSVANKPSVSLANAKAESKKSAAYAIGLCLAHVNDWLGTPHVGGDAAGSWSKAKKRHTDDNPPAGAPVFWTGGSSGHGHIALSEGGGTISTTDYPRAGHTGVGVSIHMPKDHWGLKYAGWTEDLNGVSIPGLVVVPKPPSYAVALTSGTKPGKISTTTFDLQRALIATGFAAGIFAHATGYYGKGTQAAVRKFFDAHPEFASSKTDVAIGPHGWTFLRDLAIKAGK